MIIDDKQQHLYKDTCRRPAVCIQYRHQQPGNMAYQEVPAYSLYSTPCSVDYKGKHKMCKLLSIPENART